MKRIFTVLSLVFVVGCSHTLSPIDVSAIYLDHGPDSSQYDGSTGNTANQWKGTNFTSSEMALFNDLDTARLNGTTSPSSSFQAPTYQLPAYPNPFPSIIFISTPGFGQSFNGSVVAKYVIVDNFFRPVQKNSIRLNITPTTGGPFQIGNVPAGKYRIYVTYSALGNEHFFKLWGNIWRH